mmetsp:Transcript_10541/g.13679  ORF Transcript_10541/g.13679 Transcript_10541/m.13679 type:complete len:529 (+) Transcript_10541:2-1588(+)
MNRGKFSPSAAPRANGIDCSVEIEENEVLDLHMTYSPLEEKGPSNKIDFTATVVLLNAVGNISGTIASKMSTISNITQNIVLDLKHTKEDIQVMVVTASSSTEVQGRPLERLRPARPFFNLDICTESFDEIGDPGDETTSVLEEPPGCAGRMVTRLRAVPRGGSEEGQGSEDRLDLAEDSGHAVVPEKERLEEEVSQGLASGVISPEEGGVLTDLLSDNQLTDVQYHLELINHLAAKNLPTATSSPGMDMRIEMHHAAPESVELGVTMVMCLLYRHKGNWRLSEVGMAYRGRHHCSCRKEIRGHAYPFLDQNLLKKYITSSSVSREITIGEMAQVPQKVKRLKVGLGWVVPDAFLDLDASAVLFDRSLHKANVVYWKSRSSKAIRHAGSDIVGPGAGGDDETFIINFNKLDTKIRFIVFLVNIYTESRTFREVQHCHIRLLDPETNHIFAFYKLHKKLMSRGAILAVLEREVGGWRMQPIGEESNGKKASDDDCEKCIRTALGFPTSAAKGQVSSEILLGCQPACTIS